MSGVRDPDLKTQGLYLSSAKDSPRLTLGGELVAVAACLRSSVCRPWGITEGVQEPDCGVLPMALPHHRKLTRGTHQYQFWQQNELAREHFTRAIQVAEQGGHLLEQAEPNRHLTFDALFRGDLEAALTHAQRALSFREAGGFRPYQPFDHLALRDIYLKKGDTARAEFHLQQASALASAMGFSTLVSSLIDTTNISHGHMQAVHCCDAIEHP